MFAKHFINLLYFVQVLGWNMVYSYMKHEFFTIRNRRSFVGGHFSNRTPSFLLVPLRVFLGLYWVYEGVVKILEGWLSHPMLTSFFAGANAFYDSCLCRSRHFDVGSAPILQDGLAGRGHCQRATAGGWTGSAVGPHPGATGGPRAHRLEDLRIYPPSFGPLR
jgi:NADH dehydrogenase